MAGRGHEPVPAAVGSRRGGHDGVRPHLAAGTALVAGVPEPVDAAVGADKPITLAVRSGDEGDDGSDQVLAESRAVVCGSPERCHLAIGLGEVVGESVGRRHQHGTDRGDWRGGTHTGERTAGGGGAEAQHGAVLLGEPRASAVGGDGETDHGRRDPRRRQRCQVKCVAEAEDRPARRGEPVARRRRCVAAIATIGSPAVAGPRSRAWASPKLKTPPGARGDPVSLAVGRGHHRHRRGPRSSPRATSP